MSNKLVIELIPGSSHLGIQRKAKAYRTLRQYGQRKLELAYKTRSHYRGLGISGLRISRARLNSSRSSRRYGEKFGPGALASPRRLSLE